MRYTAIALFALFYATASSAHYACSDDPSVRSKLAFRLYLQTNEAGRQIATARGTWFDGTDFYATGNWQKSTQHELTVTLIDMPNGSDWNGNALPNLLARLSIQLMPKSGDGRVIRCVATELY